MLDNRNTRVYMLLEQDKIERIPTKLVNNALSGLEVPEFRGYNQIQLCLTYLERENRKAGICGHEIVSFKVNPKRGSFTEKSIKEYYDNQKRPIPQRINNQFELTNPQIDFVWDDVFGTEH